MARTHHAAIGAGDANVTPLMTGFTLPFTEYVGGAVWTATEGRVLVAGLFVDKTIGTPTTPSGWTAGPVQVNANVSLVTYYKTAAGGESDITFAWSTNARFGGAWCGEYGAETLTGVLSNSATSGNTNVTSRATGNVTAPTDRGSLAIFMWAMDSLNSYSTSLYPDPIDGQPTWSAGSRIAGQNDIRSTIPDENGGFPGWSVAELSVAAGAGTVSSTASHAGTGATSDQASACVILLPLRLGPAPAPQVRMPFALLAR